MPTLSDFPLAPIYVQETENIYSNLDWQRVGAKVMIKHFLNFKAALSLQIEQCR